MQQLKKEVTMSRAMLPFKFRIGCLQWHLNDQEDNLLNTWQNKSRISNKWNCVYLSWNTWNCVCLSARSDSEKYLGLRLQSATLIPLSFNGLSFEILWARVPPCTVIHTRCAKCYPDRALYITCVTWLEKSLFVRVFPSCASSFLSFV